MFLRQDPETGYWTKGPGDLTLVQIHDPVHCEGYGCAIHGHPTPHPLVDRPLYWREDRGILERICVHGVGHPDHDSAGYLNDIGRGYTNVHGCDGCCTDMVPF